MLIHRFLFITGFILLGLPACAQNPTLVIENGRVIVGDGTVLESGTVVISGDRIVSVGMESEAFPGAERIDAAGRTVLPGLIDTHVHVTMEQLFEQPRSDEAMLAFVEEGVPDRLRAYIEAGITAVMSAGEFWPFIEDARRRIDSGDLVGPRMRTAGPIFTAPDGHPAATFCGYLDAGGPNPWCREHLTEEVETSQQARSAVTRLSREGANLIKLVYEESPGTEPLCPGLVVLGTDSPHLPPADAYHREIQLVAEAGLSPERVLQAATREAASHIGLGAQLGTLEGGKLADIIVVDGNPLEDLSSLRDAKVVVKSGQIVVRN